MRIIAVAALSCVFTPATITADVNESPLLSRINAAKTLDEKWRLLARAKLSDDQLSKFLSVMQDNPERDTRLFAAMALSKLPAGPLLERHLKKSIADRAWQVRAAGMLQAGLRRRTLPDDLIERELDSPESFMRTAAVLATMSRKRLFRASLDKSALVRAAASRHLAEIGPSDDKTEMARSLGALDILLIDPDPLVRSNAILASRSLRYTPLAILMGLAADKRKFVLIEDVLGRDKGDARLRGKYGTAKMHPILLHLLALRVLSMPRVNTLERLAVPLDSPLAISWVACDSLLVARAADADGFLKRLGEAIKQAEPLLAEQLRPMSKK